MRVRGSAVLLGAALLLAGCSNAELEEAEAAIVALEAELAEEEERANAESERANSESERADEAEAAARVELQAEFDALDEDLRAELNNELERQSGSLDERESELDNRELELDEREEQLAAAEKERERVMQSQFGNGTWEVGVDIQPGTYRVTPGDGCYWARLRNREGGVNSIIANNNARGGQEIVTIASSDAFFESSRCGTWSPS